MSHLAVYFRTENILAKTICIPPIYRYFICIYIYTSFLCDVQNRCCLFSSRLVCFENHSCRLNHWVMISKYANSLWKGINWRRKSCEVLFFNYESRFVLHYGLCQDFNSHVKFLLMSLLTNSHKHSSAWLPSLWIGVRLRMTLLWYKRCSFSHVNYFVIKQTRYWSLSRQGHLYSHYNSLSLATKYKTVKWFVVWLLEHEFLFLNWLCWGLIKFLLDCKMFSRLWRSRFVSLTRFKSPQARTRHFIVN